MTRPLDLRKPGTPLEPGEHWIYTCNLQEPGYPACVTKTQNGWRGLNLHREAVHGLTTPIYPGRTTP